MADQPCPCKQKLTEGQKGVFNFGLDDAKSMLQNPNAAAINAARQLGGANSSRIESLITAAKATGPGGVQNVLFTALPSLEKMKTSITKQTGIVNAFENECNRFTNPRNLTSIISSLSLFAELNCALGIEGLDINVGLNVVNNNGQFSIDYAVNANINLQNILDEYGDGFGTATANMVSNLQAGLNDVFGKMDEANNALNKIMAESNAMQQKAAAFIAKYTSINSLANLVNQASTDPCFKLGATLNGSLVSSEFLNTVSNAGFGGAGGGTSIR